MRRLAILVPLLLACSGTALAGEHPSFAGTWALDSKASDPVEELLVAKGASWIERKAAGALDVTQKIRQSDAEMVIDVESAIKSQTETVYLDGRTVERDTPKSGRIQVRTVWSEDGSKLVTTTAVVLEDGQPATFRVTRSLEDSGATMLQLLELEIADGRHYSARRVFRRK